MNNNKKQITEFYNEYHDKNLHPVTLLMQKTKCNFLKRVLKNTTGKILIVGCGSEEEMSIVNQNADIYAVDISKTAIKHSKKKYPKYKYYIADAKDLPFEDNQFDCVICSEVIEHIPENIKALKEFKRVLKKDGTVLLTTPNWISWYGLARKSAESLFKRQFSSGEQPIDDWATPRKLKKKVNSLDLKIKNFKGIWFYPPFGRGHKQIPTFITIPIIYLLYPLERLFQHILPWFGHMIYIKAKK